MVRPTRCRGGGGCFPVLFHILRITPCWHAVLGLSVQSYNQISDIRAQITFCQKDRSNQHIHGAATQSSRVCRRHIGNHCPPGPLLGLAVRRSAIRTPERIAATKDGSGLATVCNVRVRVWGRQHRQAPLSFRIRQWRFHTDALGDWAEALLAAIPRNHYLTRRLAPSLASTLGHP